MLMDVIFNHFLLRIRLYLVKSENFGLNGNLANTNSFSLYAKYKNCSENLLEICINDAKL